MQTEVLRAVRLAAEIEVPGEGTMASKLWIIGEAPGETEVKARRPFCGPAGKVLDDLLAEAGIARRECYIDNVVRFRPKGNDFEEFFAKDGTASELLLQSFAALRARIEEHRPNVVCALGWQPLQMLASQPLAGGITNWRGSVLLGVTGTKLIGTFHPSGLLRAWENRPLAVHDLRRARKESVEPELFRKPRECFLNRSFQDTMQALEDMNEQAQFVAFDIETEGNTRISSISLADSPEFAVVVPFVFRGVAHWSDAEAGALRSAIKSILENGRIQKIAQNAQYDMIWLAEKWQVNVRPLYMDTLVAHNLSMPEFEKSLGFQCSIYTDIPYYKWQGRSDDPDTFFRYNGMDSMATFDCAQEIQAQLEEDGLWEFYKRLPHALLEPLREMSLRGIRVDTALRKQMQDENKQERELIMQALREDATIQAYEEKFLRGKAVEKLRKLWQDSWDKCSKMQKFPRSTIAGKYGTLEAYMQAKLTEIPVFNPDSAEQMKEYLYEHRKFKPITARRGDGKRTLTADAAAIRKINAMGPEPVLQAFLDFADLTKEAEFLAAKLEPDGRMHCTYDVTGTETGRISSKKYVFDTGANLQNQPAGKKKQSSLRRVYVPDEGKVFLQRDLKQAEAWIVAFLSEDPFLMEAIRSSDIHRRTASLIFRKPEAEITKRERELAKRCVHALNYGMGPVKFAEQLGVSLVEARDLRNRYFAAFPRIGIWHSQTKLQLEKTREITTPLGRKRQFTRGWNEDLWKEAWAFVPQSTVGDLLNIGFLEFWRWLKADAVVDSPNAGHPHHALTLSNEQRFDCQIMLQIHDSLVVQCPEQHVPLIAKKLKACLEREIVINGHAITIPTDCAVGPNWLDLKERKDLE